MTFAHGRILPRCLFAVLAALFLSVTGNAADSGPNEVTLTGAVENPLHMTTGSLRALPSTGLTLDFMAGPHPEKGSFKGVLLWKLVNLAAVKDRGGKGSNLLHSIIVTGRDGYAVALAIAEIDPKFEGKTVLLAYDQDGRPLRNGFRLVVPGDHEGGRNVRDVVRIEVQ